MIFDGEKEARWEHRNGDDLMGWGFILGHFICWKKGKHLVT